MLASYLDNFCVGFFALLQSSQVKRTSQDSSNEYIIRELNTLVDEDFRFISALLHA